MRPSMTTSLEPSPLPPFGCLVSLLPFTGFLKIDWKGTSKRLCRKHVSDPWHQNYRGPKRKPVYKHSSNLPSYFTLNPNILYVQCYNFSTGGLFICWPVVPFISFLNLLWTRPKNWNRPESVNSVTTEAFIKAKSISTMTSGITGGIESPIQFALQVTIIFLCLVV